ncbi:MAG TPA: hypothetical protein VN279_08320 [Rhodocyclaceae bacterium]|nr:hypothetical protein [Rhodocyclaceae bacterium]
MKARLVATLLGVTATFCVHAAEFSGVKAIRLANPAGEAHEIGKVTFTPLGNGRSAFRITLDPSLQEYFLAMRPFLCLTGPQQRLCHFGVEREPPEVSASDLVPLEYALMFMRTAPTSLHVNPFNGVIYKMQIKGQRIEGRLYELDMDPFITPDSVPVERRKRPVAESDLIPADPASHWLPLLVIE